MSDPTSQTTDLARTPDPLVLFDGVCNLCNGAVRWILKRDDDGVFRFGSLQWESARSALVARVGARGLQQLPDSIVLVDENGVHTRSTAALKIAARLGAPWSVLAVFLAVPRPVRDGAYDWIARNRYRWFGRRDACMMPTPELEDRFLSAD